MSAGRSYRQHLPRGPYAYVTSAREGQHDGSGVVHVVDASGRKIAAMYGQPDEKLALTELLIDARENPPEIKP